MGVGKPVRAAPWPVGVGLMKARPGSGQGSAGPNPSVRLPFVLYTNRSDS